MEDDIFDIIIKGTKTVISKLLPLTWFRETFKTISSLLTVTFFTAPIINPLRDLSASIHMYWTNKMKSKPTYIEGTLLDSVVLDNGYAVGKCVIEKITFINICLRLYDSGGLITIKKRQFNGALKVITKKEEDVKYKFNQQNSL